MRSFIIKGFFSLVLHAHLPFIRHPEHEIFMEENWFYEACIETYIPLLKNFDDLVKNKIDFRITVSLSPSLCEMFTDELLQKRFNNRMKNLIKLSEKELVRTKNTVYYTTAKMYHDKLTNFYDIYSKKYKKNLLNGFKHFRDLNKIEIITCEATHAFLPLLNQNQNTINAQIEIGVKNFYKHMGEYPKGIWNSECAYYPGLEKSLKRWGIKYFFVDTHGVLYAEKRPKYGVFAPLYCENKVAVFARDVESSREVWSATEGYPGDYVYREFYRDIGFDLDFEYIKPYLYSDGIRMMTGFKYYSITGKTENKKPYDYDTAVKKAREHATDFTKKREKQIMGILDIIDDRKPLVVSPYDAELFGHWWFEGPDFIKFLCKEMHKSKIIDMITPTEYLDIYPDNQISTPSLSTWGNQGYMNVWLNKKNDWIYPHIHVSTERMTEMSNKYSNTKDKMIIRILNQMARELLISQTSCWAFIISTGTTVEFALKKITTHIHRFITLYEMLNEEKIDDEFLKQIESRDSIFPEIDYMAYSDNHLEAEIKSK